MSSPDETVNWHKIIERLDAFAESWESGEGPPDLEAFLVANSATQNAITFVELVKLDLEFRWQRGCDGRMLEDYAQRHPSLLNVAGEWPIDLIHEEFHIRRQSGEAVTLSEYCRRFPLHADEIRAVLDLNSADASTSLSKRRHKIGFAAGETLADFDLLLLLGEGAFAQVFLARQISMQRLVALKISVAEGDEHKTLAQLDHPHIVRVFSQTVLEELGLRLLYMQYHPGGTLKEVVDRMKRLSYSERNGRRFVAELDVVLEEKGATIPLNSLIRKKLISYDWPQVVCWLGARLAEALDYSHGLGVLHRDLKPANVLLADDGSPKLADFNVSFSDRIEGSTPVANFGGSLAYMSPEQLAACDPKNDFRPEQLDARSDIYSLGILLWELLTGERPFPDLVSGTFGSKLLHDMTVKRQQGPDFDQLPDELPPLLVQALKSALVPNRDLRCPSATALARELELGTDPEVQRILAPPSDGIGSFMLNFPIWTIVIMAFVCNGGMSLLNIYYNSDEIIQLAQMDIFKLQVGLLNVLCYGSAIAIGIWLMRPVRQALKAPESVAGQADQQVRLRVLHLGYLIAGIGLSGWLICGILFPLGLHLMTGQSVLDDYIHFSASHAINGSLAAAAVFFLVSDFALEQIFPRVVRLDEADPTSYRSLSRFCLVVHVILGYTICLPLVSVLLACLLTEKNTEAFAVLALLGLVGVAGAYRWSLKVRRNAAALMTITAS